MTERNPQAQPPEDYERNYPGSPYIELDMSNNEMVSKIGAYYIQLQKEQEHWFSSKGPYSPPWEKFPGAPGVKLKLLEVMVRQDGKLNFWDVSMDYFATDGNISEYFQEGCEQFVRELGLEVKEVS